MKIKTDELIIEKFEPLLKDVLLHRHTHYTLPGGRGGTKSSFVGLAVPLLIMLNPGVHAAVFRKIFGTLRDSCYAQILAGIELLGVGRYFKCTVSPMEITYLPTGQKILFRGLDAPEKVKSIKVPFGYIGVTWFEELDQFYGREEVRMVLQSTMRGGDSFWNFESFNPPASSASWVNKELLQKREGRMVVKSSYLDVPKSWLGNAFFEEAEEVKRLSPRTYRHEYLGEAVGSGGNVFENVAVRKITHKERMGFDRIYMGIDWGWYPDPFHWAKMHYDAARRTLYIFDEYRAHKTGNLATWEHLKEKKGVCADDMICADSAEQKSIEDYRGYGAKCRGAKKGPGSVEYSMKWLQALAAIIIDPEDCPFTAAEFLEYEYGRGKNGEIMGGYPDEKNHAIDAVRYAMERVWRRKEF